MKLYAGHGKEWLIDSCRYLSRMLSNALFLSMRIGLNHSRCVEDLFHFRNGTKIIEAVFRPVQKKELSFGGTVEEVVILLLRDAKRTTE